MKPRVQLFAFSLLVVPVFAPAAMARDVPYVQTPMAVVQKMLQMGRAAPGEIVYDLGSGDGRIVISAVHDFKVDKAVGIDIDPDRVVESWQNARAAGVAERATFIQQNIFEADFSEATILTMYLLNRVNMRLRPRILSEMKPGSRVVSHQFSMGDWEPDERAQVSGRNVYLWIVPARVQGTWRWMFDGQEFRVALTQQYQNLTGVMQAPGGGAPDVRLRQASVAGDRLRLTAHVAHDGGVSTMRLEGRVDGGKLTGEISFDGRTSPAEARLID